MDRRSCGFALIELIVVVTLLGILGAIAVAVLGENDIVHQDSLFNRFIIENFDEVCPSGGGSLVMRMEK